MYQLHVENKSKAVISAFQKAQQMKVDLYSMD